MFMAGSLRGRRRQMARTDGIRVGAKIRSLRRKADLTQAQMAKALQISPSYLNLIENDRRPLSASVLIRLAQEFHVDVHAFGARGDKRLQADLMEVFGDPIFDGESLKNADVRELVEGSPNAAKAVLTLYSALQNAKENTKVLTDQLTNVDPTVHMSTPLLPSEEVSECLQQNNNYFPDIEKAAERLWNDASLDSINLYYRLCQYVKEKLNVQVEIFRSHTHAGAQRIYDPKRKRILLSERLQPRSRHFQLAHQVGLLTQEDLFTRLANDKRLTTSTSKRLMKVALANYFSGAVLMPYEAFIEAARHERYDIEIVGHRFRTSFEQVCHRFTTLQRPGNKGIPFHMIRVDVAGNISKRFSGSGIRFARYSGICPRWNVFAAFSTPGMIRTQVSIMPDEKKFFCMARTVRGGSGGFSVPTATYAIGLGCELQFATDLVYGDGLDLSAQDAGVPVGVTCRLCERMDCTQRAFPPLHSPVEIDENRRGLSFYAPKTIRLPK